MDNIPHRAFFDAFILPYYQEKHRAYHTPKHIDEMFGIAKRMGIKLTNDQIVAIWFHDIVYVPSSPHNEEMSILLMNTILSQNYSTFFAAFGHVNFDIIRRIILDTKKHVSTIEESKVVLDLDMAIMAASPERYLEYARDVEYEFSAYTVGEFKAGRSKFLKEIHHTRIFNLDIFHALLDEIAQNNIEAELQSMR